MFRRITSLVVLAITTGAGAALAQITSQTTQPPAVTAENRQWYLSGEPISFGGLIYYPSGPITHFNRNEMVETGTFEGVPIYVRTTVEIGSMIFVPLAGGVVRPYEQRRAGQLAGTSGSTSPSFVIQPPQPAGQTFQPPSFVYAPPDTLTRRPLGRMGSATSEPAEPPAVRPLAAGTTGVEAQVMMLPGRPGPTRIQTVQRPVGLNGVYLEFQNARWFAAGPAIEVSADRFKKIGEYRGFPVYADQAHPDMIYVALIAGAPGLVSPYKKR